MKRMAYLPLALLFLLLLPGLSAAQDVQSYIDQGIKHSQAGRYDQALQAFDQALKLKPNDPALITYKGIVYYAKGQNDRALKEFEAAIKLNPNFGRAYYQRGMIYEKPGEVSTRPWRTSRRPRTWGTGSTRTSSN